MQLGAHGIGGELPTQGRRRKLALGLADAALEQGRAKAHRKAEHPHAEEVGRAVVAELVEDDQRRKADDGDENGHRIVLTMVSIFSQGKSAKVVPVTTASIEVDR